MIPHLSPAPLDEEPLLRRPLLSHGGGKEESDGLKSRSGSGPRQRQPRHFYSSASRSITLWLPHGRLVKVENDEEDGEEDEEDTCRQGRLKTSLLQFGPCGLAACGNNNVWWGGLAVALKLVAAFFFFTWTIILLALAVCTLIR